MPVNFNSKESNTTTFWSLWELTQTHRCTHINKSLKKYVSSAWWWTPLIPALGEQKQVDLEFKVSLAYTASFRQATTA